MIHHYKFLKNSLKKRTNKFHNKVYYWIKDVIKLRFLSRIKWWVLHRTTSRYDIVKTDLKPGYYDTDTRMLHACFGLLVEFVEEELAWMSLACSNSERSKIPWYLSKSKYVKKNCKRLGLEYLQWELTLRMDIDCNGCLTEGDLQINHEGTQGWAASEKLKLYKWWTEERLKELENIDNLLYSSGREWHEAERIHSKKQCEMLCRLMKIRETLWS